MFVLEIDGQIAKMIYIRTTKKSVLFLEHLYYKNLFLFIQHFP